MCGRLFCCLVGWVRLGLVRLGWFRSPGGELDNMTEPIKEMEQEQASKGQASKGQAASSSGLQPALNDVACTLHFLDIENEPNSF